MTRFSVVLAVVASSLVACVSPPDTEVGGGPRFQLTPQTSEAQCAGDAAADAGNGHRFSDLYRDYFGPTSRASCAGTAGNCHGSAQSMGALGSNGYVCGDTAAACWQGMTQAGLLADTSPSANLLLSVLRRCDSSGSMPKAPSDFFFYADDLQRVRDWLAAGAPND